MTDTPDPAETIAEPRKPDEPLSNEDGTPTRYGWRRIGEQLRKPMQARQRKGRGGMNFSYITARQVQDRLDAVVGPGNWSTKFWIIDDKAPAVQCALRIFDSERQDAGYSNDPESEHEVEPLKAAFSDAFKRAAVQFGVGRFLYGDV